MAASLVLMFCAGLFARNLAAVRGIDPGYASAGLQWTQLELQSRQLRSIDHAAYFRPVLDQVAALPHVTHVALAMAFPTTEIRHVMGRIPFSRADAEPGRAEVGGRVEWVSQDFFETVGVPLLQGREFTWSDTADQPLVAIINRSLVSRLYPEADAIGRRIGFSDRTQVFTIVGVVADASPGDLRITHLPILYRPLLQNPQLLSSPILLVRASNRHGLLA